MLKEEGIIENNRDAHANDKWSSFCGTSRTAMSALIAALSIGEMTSHGQVSTPLAPSSSLVPNSIRSAPQADILTYLPIGGINLRLFVKPIASDLKAVGPVEEKVAYYYEPLSAFVVNKSPKGGFSPLLHDIQPRADDQGTLASLKVLVTSPLVHEKASQVVVNGKPISPSLWPVEAVFLVASSKFDGQQWTAKEEEVLRSSDNIFTLTFSFSSENDLRAFDTLLQKNQMNFTFYYSYSGARVNRSYQKSSATIESIDEIMAAHGIDHNSLTNGEGVFVSLERGDSIKHSVAQRISATTISITEDTSHVQPTFADLNELQSRVAPLLLEQRTLSAGEASRLTEWPSIEAAAAQYLQPIIEKRNSGSVSADKTLEHDSTSRSQSTGSSFGISAFNLLNTGVNDEEVHRYQNEVQREKGVTLYYDKENRRLIPSEVKVYRVRDWRSNIQSLLNTVTVFVLPPETSLLRVSGSASLTDVVVANELSELQVRAKTSAKEEEIQQMANRLAKEINTLRETFANVQAKNQMLHIIRQRIEDSSAKLSPGSASAYRTEYLRSPHWIVLEKAMNDLWRIQSQFTPSLNQSATNRSQVSLGDAFRAGKGQLALPPEPWSLHYADDILENPPFTVTREILGKDKIENKDDAHKFLTNATGRVKMEEVPWQHLEHSLTELCLIGSLVASEISNQVIMENLQGKLAKEIANGLQADRVRISTIENTIRAQNKAMRVFSIQSIASPGVLAQSIDNATPQSLKGP